jgi:hypothetical protein
MQDSWVIAEVMPGIISVQFAFTGVKNHPSADPEEFVMSFSRGAIYNVCFARTTKSAGEKG